MPNNSDLDALRSLISGNDPSTISDAPNSDGATSDDGETNAADQQPTPDNTTITDTDPDPTVDVMQPGINQPDENAHPVQCVPSSLLSDNDILENLRLVHCQLNAINRMHLENIIDIEKDLIKYTSKAVCERAESEGKVDVWKEKVEGIMSDITKQNFYARFPKKLPDPGTLPPDIDPESSSYSAIRGILKKIIDKISG